MKKTVPVEVYMEEIYCDDCNEELKSDNIVYTTFPPTYSYHCPKCGKKYEFHEQYPKMFYNTEVKK